jgi:hypothetical protein
MHGFRQGPLLGFAEQAGAQVCCPKEYSCSRGPQETVGAPASFPAKNIFRFIHQPHWGERALGVRNDKA